MIKKQLAPHQQRVVDEHTELSNKTFALSEFIESNTIFKTLDSDEQERMKEQLHYMEQYRDVLGRRMAAFCGQESPF